MTDRRPTPRLPALPSSVASPDVLLAACAARLEAALDGFARSLDSLEASIERLAQRAAAGHRAAPGRASC